MCARQSARHERRQPAGGARGFFLSHLGVLIDYPTGSWAIITPCVASRISAPPKKELAMTKPVIFTISAAWDDEASVWSGHCDDIPAAADAPTLDELLAKISAMALDLLPDNHPEVDPASLYLQITALREAEPAAA